MTYVDSEKKKKNGKFRNRREANRGECVKYSTERLSEELESIEGLDSVVH